MDLSNTILVTHTFCMDGSTSALLFLAAGGKKENIRFSVPSHEDVDQLLSDLQVEKDLLLVDISCSEEMASYYKDHPWQNITILDHHKSAIPLNKFSFCKIDTDNQNCGCKLFYNWLMSNSNEHHDKIHKYKELVDFVDDNDRWIHNYPESAQLSRLHKILGPELFMDRFINNANTDLTAQETYLLDIYCKKEEMDIKHKKKNVTKVIKTINGNDYTFGFVMLHGEDQSTIGHAICDDPQLDVDVAILIYGNNISFRSRHDCDLDLSALAKLNLGGGVMHAGGTKISCVIGKSLIELISEKLKYE